ncbi:probable RNA-directed DNA polymerase from transposon BS [Trichonephila clavipes]|nr:probable RNA-directed DNA polymerase from transposon BS [Trichonephila clavipes]
MKVGGKILTSDLDIAKIFLKYYRKVSNFRPRRQIRKREINSRVNQKWDRLFSAPFSDEEFQRALQKLSRGKNAGPNVLHLDSCGHISEKQAGFRRSYNTTEQIVRLTQYIKDGFQKKQSTLVVFVDFKSAFDRIWRKMLLKKLLHMNVSGHLFKWINDFFSQCFLNIKYGNSRSGYGQTRQGLPQGSVLSPVLFNIMIKDLLSFINNAVPEINSLLYADDLVLWSTGSDIPKLESTLNSALVTLASWSLENDFKVNPDNTNFELFTLSTKKHINLVYNNNAILRTDCATYLGISLDSRLTWTKHIAKVVENATSRLSLLKRIAGVKWGSSQSVLTSPFTSYIRPVIDYGSELLVTASDSALSKLDTVQNKALRFITGAATSTPIASMQLKD